MDVLTKNENEINIFEDILKTIAPRNSDTRGTWKYFKG